MAERLDKREMVFFAELVISNMNAWLVEHGFAQAITVPPNVKYQEPFLKLQREAREARRGLWSDQR